MQCECEWIVCPTCRHQFDSADGFYWGADQHGHPTIEMIKCPACGEHAELDDFDIAEMEDEGE